MKTSTTIGLGLLTALALAACSDDVSSPDGASSLDADMAIVAADAALEDVATMGDPDGLGAGGPFDRSRTVTYLDADGNEQQAYDELTTESVHIVVDFEGEMAREFWEASIERHRDMMLTGLEGEETTRIWNGTGDQTATRSRHFDDGEVRTYDMSGQSTVEDVVLGVPREDNPWPLSGTITRAMTATITNGPNGDETRERTVVIIFNGTQFPEMTVNGEPFDFDLSTRAGDRPVHRRRF